MYAIHVRVARLHCKSSIVDPRLKVDCQRLDAAISHCGIVLWVHDQGILCQSQWHKSQKAKQAIVKNFA